MVTSRAVVGSSQMRMRGAAGHGDGDDHPLAHTAGKLVRVLLVPPPGVVDAHIRQNLQHGVVGCLALQALMQLHRLLNLFADGFQRVQGGHGVLKDHGDLPAPDGLPVLIGAEFGQIHAVVEDGAAVNKAVGVQKAHGALDEHGLTGAGLAHDGEALALMHIQRNAPDGMEHLSPEGKLHV